MSRPKLHVVGSEEVQISREGDSAVFTYADEKMGGLNLRIGPKIKQMTNEELLELHNDMVSSVEAHRREYEHTAVEIPIGKPQIVYNKRFGQWSMRGDVLRCLIEDTVSTKKARPNRRLRSTTGNFLGVSLAGCLLLSPDGA